MPKCQFHSRKWSLNAFVKVYYSAYLHQYVPTTTVTPLDKCHTGGFYSHSNMKMIRPWFHWLWRVTAMARNYFPRAGGFGVAIARRSYCIYQKYTPQACTTLRYVALQDIDTFDVFLINSDWVSLCIFKPYRSKVEKILNNELKIDINEFGVDVESSQLKIVLSSLKNQWIEENDRWISTKQTYTTYVHICIVFYM